ncbi:MAG: hypothetical protein NTV87_08070 [Ignavibacteriae bacterium]|nr:hypothetical protein [Ignavibacteriota bacterium]
MVENNGTMTGFEVESGASNIKFMSGNQFTFKLILKSGFAENYL